MNKKLRNKLISVFDWLIGSVGDGRLRDGKLSEYFGVHGTDGYRTISFRQRVVSALLFRLADACSFDLYYSTVNINN